MPPSTEWREVTAADEAARFAGYARTIVAMQRENDRRFGKGRGAHRKGHLGAYGRLDVAPNLPAYAAHGLFASASRHEVWVRLSNGAAEVGEDRRPDARGFAIKVFGVRGEAADDGTTDVQDFALIHLPAFTHPTSRAFMDFVMAIARGPLALVRHMVSTYGVVGAAREGVRIARLVSSRFDGFASGTFHSCAPIACGPYAAHVRLRAAGDEPSASGTDWASDVASRLRDRALEYDLELQFFVDESRTPIEDASVAWPESVAPFVTVARLVLPRQDVGSPEGVALSRRIEDEAFDPWNALAAHRPLGDVMRARRVVYAASRRERGARARSPG